MAYGIGRVPADVDPNLEALANLEARKIMDELLRQPRRPQPHPVMWNGTFLNWRPYLGAREEPRPCASCGQMIPSAELVPCFTNGGAALCDPCGRRITDERDAAALDYLLSHRGELKAKAVSIHLHGNDYQLGARHWEWLVGHACLELCTAAKIEPPSWWGDWQNPGSPLSLVARLVKGAHDPVGPARQPETYQCRRCGAAGVEGQSPFTTLPGSGLCDDCC